MTTPLNNPIKNRALMHEAETTTEPVPCPLCGGFNDYVLARRGYPGIKVTNVICKNCALVRIHPRPLPSWYERFYKEEFFTYLDPFNRPTYVNEIERTTDASFVTETERIIISFVLDHVKEGGSVLDVGAGFGQVLYLLKKKKRVIATGIEPDPGSRAIAKEKMGLTLTDTTIEEFLKTTKRKFDFIVLDQVFEHLLDPVVVLQGLSKSLAPEGTLYIGVPNTYNPLVPMRIFFQIAHTFNYTPATMKLFAEKAGLKIIKIKDPRISGFEILLAHKGSSYRDAPEELLALGGDWREIVSILRRKRILNIIRGTAKYISKAVLGERRAQKLRTMIDRAINYRY